jgi:hypothetical protein
MKATMSRLMAEVLDRQVEPDEPFDDLAFALRVREALRGSAELPDDLARMVWISPTARSIFLRLRAEALAAAKRRWSDRGFSTELERMAADSDSDFETFSASGVSMRMVHNAATGRWMITLQLTAEAFEELPAGISIKVSDSGGLVWLEGVLDRHGGLDGFWEDDTTGPRERLREHRLIIDLF